MITACHNCRIGPSKACLTCRRVSQDDIRIQRTPHNRSELQATTTPTAGRKSTDLPDEIEDKLRRFLFDLFDLDPIQLLMLQHVKQGGTPVSFGSTFARFLKSSIKYGDRERSADWNRAVETYGAHIGQGDMGRHGQEIAPAGRLPDMGQGARRTAGRRAGRRRTAPHAGRPL